MIDPNKLTLEQRSLVDALFGEVSGTEDCIPLDYGPPAPLPTLKELEEQAGRLDSDEIEAFAEDALVEIAAGADEDPKIRDEASEVLRKRGRLPGPGIIPLPACGSRSVELGFSSFGKAAAIEESVQLGDHYLSLFCYEDADRTLTFDVQSRQLPDGTRVELMGGSWRGVVEMIGRSPGTTGGKIEIRASERTSLPDKASLSDEVVIHLQTGEVVRHRLGHARDRVD
jgi:hypothetical protein